MTHNRGAAWLGRQEARRYAGEFTHGTVQDSQYFAEKEKVMNITEVINGIKANQHAKVLIVGVRGDNFPPRYHQHPQLVFWEGQDQVSGVVPQAVRLIIPTRFINHPLWVKLAEEARKRAIPLMQLSGTGEVKRLLEPLMPVQQDAAGVTIPNPDFITPEVKRIALKSGGSRLGLGVLRDFVATHADREVLATVIPGMRSGAQRAESERLLALAASQGITTTAHSIDVALRVLRESLGETAKQADINRRRSEKQKANFAAKREAMQAPAPSVPPPHTALAAIADDDRELLIMARDAIAALELIKGKLEDRAQKKARLFEALKDL